LQAEKGRIGVDMVETAAVVNGGVVVEHVRVESGVHALSGTTGREAPAAAEEDLDGGKGVDVVVVDRNSVEPKIDVRHVHVGLMYELMTTGVSGFCGSKVHPGRFQDGV